MFLKPLHGLENVFRLREIQFVLRHDSLALFREVVADIFVDWCFAKLN